MSVSRQERRQLERQVAKARRKEGIPSRPQTNNRWSRWTAPLLVGVVFLISVVLAIRKSSSPNQNSQSSQTNNSAQLPEITDLVKMSNEELAEVGIAKMNLACAKGIGPNPMTDAEVAGCFDNIQKMVAAVRLHTAHNFYKFAKTPSEYENSEIYYKVAMLITVIQQDFGVHYNMAKATMATGGETDHFYDDPADVFVLGAFGMKRTGTCSSMPVACVAVGRELGYPLKLAGAKGHLFFRWDDGVKKMHFECTNRVNIRTDEEFRKWPHPISDEEMAKGLYLKNLTPREELAVFLSIRASVLDYFKKGTEAVNAIKLAYDIDPHPNYAAAGRAIWGRLGAMQQNQAQLTSTALYEDDDFEAEYRRLMLPYYQKQGLNFVPGSIPLPRPQRSSQPVDDTTPR